VSMVCSMVLAIRDRGWALTAIAVTGFAVNFGLNLFLIPISMKWLGVGGGGPGCASAMLGTEIVVTSALLFLMGKEAFDRRALVLTAKCLVGCVLAIAVDRALAFLGPWRLVPDAGVYVAFVLVSRAMPFKEMIGMVRGAFQRPAVTT
jgi:hypothetical protein